MYLELFWCIPDLVPAGEVPVKVLAIVVLPSLHLKPVWVHCRDQVHLPLTELIKISITITKTWWRPKCIYKFNNKRFLDGHIRAHGFTLSCPSLPTMTSLRILKICSAQISYYGTCLYTLWWRRGATNNKPKAYFHGNFIICTLNDSTLPRHCPVGW